jgi:hypothetical protein
MRADRVGADSIVGPDGAARRVAARLERLAADLKSGRWHAAHADLLDWDDFDVGYVTITADL